VAAVGGGTVLVGRGWRAADSVGPQANDMITNISGQSATSNVQWQGLILTEKPGNIVSIDHISDGHSATAAITPGAQP